MAFDLPEPFEEGSLAVVASNSGLPGRPIKHPTAHQMNMQVKDRLSGLRPGIDHEPKPLVGNPLLPRQATRQMKEVPRQGLFLIGHARESVDVSLRDDQQVDWSLGINILKSKRLIVVMDNFTRNLPRHNSAKNTVFHFKSLFFFSSRPERPKRLAISPNTCCGEIRRRFNATHK